jgi:DNA (cytosine-5)-methyltransferase 1
MLTLGSLFSGSGAFELAATRHGIKPVWASEVEPFPIAVTRKHFPDMLHFGDINKINGADVLPVDIITGGFCCQDLSVAGRQAGLHGERSGLFFQMIRIIREMLSVTDGAFPKYLIFENVPGLLSSNKGKDVIEVLNAIANLGFVIDSNILDAQEFGVAQRRKRVFIACINRRYFNADHFTDIPKIRDKRMDKVLTECGGEIFHGIASRLHTAVRQHLSEILEKDVDKRFYLSVAACLGILRRVDSKGKEIPAILRAALESQAGLNADKIDGEPHAFNPGICGRLGRKGSSGVSPSLLAHAGDNQTAVCYPIDDRNALRKSEDNCGVGIGSEGESAYTVTAEHQGSICLEHHPNDSRIKIKEDGICQCLEARAGLGGGNVPLVMNERQYAHTVGENIANTLTGTDYKGSQILCIQGNIIGRKLENGANGKGVNDGISYTLTEADKHAVCYQDIVGTLDTGLAKQNSNQTVQSGKMIVEEVAFGIDRAAYNQGANALYKPQIDVESTHSLTARGPGAVSAPPSYVVRRLTPTECLVLMDLPRDWCEGLENENPTVEDLMFWTDVFETYRRINNPNGKPKTENQIRKFLRKPFSDSACYKMAGNGLVTAVAEFVLQGICEYENSNQ